jgi:hypothetical protein
MVPLVIHSDPNCRGVQRWINARGLLVQQATDGNRRGGPTFNRQVRWSTLQLFVERRSQVHNATSLAMASGICLMLPAVMSFGGFLGVGEDYYPSPWQLLTYNPQLGGYEVNIGEEQLKGAPKFAKNESWDWSPAGASGVRPLRPTALLGYALAST